MQYNFKKRKDIKTWKHRSRDNITKHTKPKFEARNPKNDVNIVVQSSCKICLKMSVLKLNAAKRILFCSRNLCFYNIFLPNIITYNVNHGYNWETLEHRCEGRQSP